MANRSAESDIQLLVKSTMMLTVDDGWRTSVKVGGWVLKQHLLTGVESDQANRGWGYEGTIASGNVVDLDLYDMAGLNTGGGAGRDGLGQALAMEEIVSLGIAKISGSGQLEVMPTQPANYLTWVPPLTVADGNALKTDGVALMHQSHTDAFDVEDGSSHVLRLGANGGDV